MAQARVIQVLLMTLTAHLPDESPTNYACEARDAPHESSGQVVHPRVTKDNLTPLIEVLRLSGSQYRRL